MLADGASGAVTEQAMHVEFGAGLGETENSWREAHRRARKRARKFAEHAFQMAIVTRPILSTMKPSICVNIGEARTLKSSRR